MNIATTIAATRPDADSCCFHCGEVIPENTDIRIVIDGKECAMCCPGCRAVAHAINEYGLENYYRYRTGFPSRPEYSSTQSLPDLEIYDNPDFQKPFVR